MIRLRKKKPGFFEQIVSGNTIIDAHDRRAGLNFLVSFFNEVRPASEKRKVAEKNLLAATEQLQKHRIILANMQHALLSQINNTDLTAAITESGIPLARGFWQELSNRLKHKILPPLMDEDDFLYVINQVFYRKSDFKWVEAVSRQAWMGFFEAAGFDFGMANVEFKKELLQAMKILSFQVAQLGLEKMVLDYLPKEQQHNDTPFVIQNYKVHDLEKLLLDNTTEHEVKAASFQLKNDIENCYELISHIRESHSEKGASIQQTYILLILSNRLQRMQLITDVLDTDTTFDTGRFVDIFTMLVRNEKRKNSIREFLSQGVGYLAYQIAEHKGSKGHKYITETRKEFYRMIYSAMWGGLIISFVAIVKNLIGKLKLAPFPAGFLFSVNYSAGFILIEETGSTLATKQPAFTASAVASSLDTKKNEGEPDIEGLAAMVAKVSRSQIASFLGNLIIVFPLTFLLAWGYHEFSGTKIAEGEAAMQMLRDQHPWRSAALLYACFTGFFLFASGIIAGYWQNKIRYGQIRERMIKHPVLKRSFSPKRLNGIAIYVEKHFGAIMGNLALGFFLGFSGVMGNIFGIPFDIRHITIAAGNTAIGAYGFGLENIPPYFMLAVLGGVLGIGFLNFLISFSLAFVMAVKSRGIHLSQYPRLFRTIGNYFFMNPREFILPSLKAKETVYRPLKRNEN
ncbi:MAG: hypothetical protein FJY20_04125 [Bacteroidetes bacterium]|nr:hypothetical protein [Bacteroidota bacterium]